MCKSPRQEQPPAHLLDMDGVLVRGSAPIENSAKYIQILNDADVPYKVFSNNSRFTPEVVAERLQDVGFQVTDRNIYTSALTTAQFVSMQKPDASCFVIGEEGLKRALELEGLKLDDSNPDYVVVGESINFSFSEMAKGAQLISAGAKFLGTNPDNNIPVDVGLYPACGAACALIEKATGIRPYFLGKPNPFMMRGALEKLNVQPAESIMIGDRLDTDIIAGMELGLQTGLVLTGTSSRDDLREYPYGPDIVVDSLYDLASVFRLG